MVDAVLKHKSKTLLSSSSIHMVSPATKTYEEERWSEAISYFDNYVAHPSFLPCKVLLSWEFTENSRWPYSVFPQGFGFTQHPPKCAQMEWQLQFDLEEVQRILWTSAFFPRSRGRKNPSRIFIKTLLRDFFCLFVVICYQDVLVGLKNDSLPISVCSDLLLIFDARKFPSKQPFKTRKEQVFVGNTQKSRAN